MVPIETLGERIRNLRKKKKMTLEELAGEKLSKGMLSLIENNKAKPSMESLTYIAQRLDISVADLLEEKNQTDLRSIVEKAEKLSHSEGETDQDHVNVKFKKVTALIEPVLNQLSNGYESARLLELYSYSLFYSNQEGWLNPLNQAATIYEELNLTARRASIGIFRSSVKFTEHDYLSALQVLLEERGKIEQNEPYIDPLTRLDFDYHEAVYRLAVGEVQSAMKMIEDAISFSKEHKIFYHIDDLFRLAAGYGLLFRDKEILLSYTNKLDHYGKFIDDSFYSSFNDLITAEIMLLEENAGEAFQLVEKHLQEKRFEQIDSHFTIVKGKALYGLARYKESLQWLEKVEVPPYLHHPYDLSMLYFADTYKALCYLKINQIEQALRFATLAKENFAMLPDTFYKKFTDETYREVVNEMKEKR